jgi:dipeptide/tripeptide permease
LAGIGMAIGQLFYWRGQKYLAHVGNLVKVKSTSKSDSNLISKIFEKSNSMIGFFLTLGLALTIYLYWESWSYALLVAGLAFAVGIAIVIYNDGSKIEKDRILVTYIAFLIVIVFWGAFEQAGGLMNLYAKQKTDLVLTESFIVPASWFQSLNAIFIIIFASVIGSFWRIVLFSTISQAIIASIVIVLGIPKGLDIYELKEANVIRNRVTGSIVIPLGAILFGGVISVLISQVFINFHDYAPLFALIISAAILLFASVMSSAPKIKITRNEVLIAAAGVITLTVIIASVAASQN